MPLAILRLQSVAAAAQEAVRFMAEVTALLPAATGSNNSSSSKAPTAEFLPDLLKIVMPVCQ